jgi:hypothetical protein
MENYVWEWPDPTAGELRRFVERDFGQCLVNALRDVGVTLGIMTFADECPPISAWLDWIGEREPMTIPEEIKEKLLHINDARYEVAHGLFPSLGRMELDAVRMDIVDVMMWLRNEFPAAGVEYLPDDFGS